MSIGTLQQLQKTAFLREKIEIGLPAAAALTQQKRAFAKVAQGLLEILKAMLADTRLDPLAAFVGHLADNRQAVAFGGQVPCLDNLVHSQAVVIVQMTRTSVS